MLSVSFYGNIRKMVIHYSPDQVFGAQDMQ